MGLAADFVLIVVAGLLGGVLAQMLRLPLLVGYVVAGIFVGPHTAGPTVVQIKDIETLAEIGVALLLFSIGLEVSFRDLKIVQRICLIGAPIQILLTIGLSAVAGMTLLGFGTVKEALWFGAMVSVSSTMVVLKVLQAGRVSSTLASRVMIGLLLMQDLAVIPMLIILPQLGGTPETMVTRVGAALGLAAVLLVVVYFAGTWMLPPLFRIILTRGSRELFLVAVVATSVGIGAAMHAGGFSFALGAFVAGLILSESEFSHQALTDLAPLRDIFGLMFFVTVGMLFDPTYAIRNAAWIAAVVAAILVGKAVLFGLLAYGFGYRLMAPWIIGLGLSQIGEFSFVLARTGLQEGFVSKAVYDLALTATVVTMALSPLLSAMALPLGRAWQRWFPQAVKVAVPVVVAEGMRNHAVIAGFGRTGRVVAKAFEDAGVACVVVESSYSVYADVQGAGIEGLWGDVTREEILQAAGIGSARVLVLTMTDRHTMASARALGERLHPGVAVVTRRVDDVEREEGMAMASVGLKAFGLSRKDRKDD